MRIALINGSPKVHNSASGTLLSDRKGYLGERAELVEIGLHSAVISKEVITELEKSDVWVFAYPLYVDGIPGHMLSCLMQLEEAQLQKQVSIYGIVNCGFYEGIIGPGTYTEGSCRGQAAPSRAWTPTRWFSVALAAVPTATVCAVYPKGCTNAARRRRSYGSSTIQTWIADG